MGFGVVKHGISGSRGSIEDLWGAEKKKQKLKQTEFSQMLMF